MADCKRQMTACSRQFTALSRQLPPALILAAACQSADVVSVPPVVRLVAVAGDGQRGGAGATLVAPLVVRAENASDGSAAKGVRIRFVVAGTNSSGARVDDPIVVTGTDGTASGGLTLGTPDTTRVDAFVATTPTVRVRFTAVAGLPPALASVTPVDVRPGDTLTLAGNGFSGARVTVRLGGARVTALSGRTDAVVRAVAPACMAPGASAAIVEVDGSPSNAQAITVRESRSVVGIQPYEYATIPAAFLGGCVALPGEGTYVVSAQFASAPDGEFAPAEWLLGADAIPGNAMELPVSPGAGTVLRIRRPGGLAREFDLHRRSLERTLAPAVRAERGASSAKRASGLAELSVVPPETRLGSLRAFHVVAATDGSRFTTVTGRLDYAGDRVLAYADTATRMSAGQFTALARLMDRDLVTAAVEAFGAEPDVDGNGRVIVLLTPVVNALVRPDECVLRGIVTGFFYPIDEFARGANSNGGEVFYGFAPDSAGRYSCPHPEGEVVRTLQATFLHEMQHLISFNTHVLAQGSEVEHTWLNEGLSHVAEELGSRLFEARYPAPLGRGTAEQLFPDSAAPYIAPQMLNAYVYLTRPLLHSVTAYAGAGSLEERGATWLFLRWLIAQHGDGMIRRLAQSSRRGVASVEAATGESLGTLFGDFGLALFADSLPGLARSVVPPRLRFGTRNVRQLMAREATISGFANPFPLTTFLLTRGTALRGTMLPGTMIHAILPGEPGAPPVRLTFSTPSGAPLAAALGGQVSIMRLPP